MRRELQQQSKLIVVIIPFLCCWLPSLLACTRTTRVLLHCWNTIDAVCQPAQLFKHAVLHLDLYKSFLGKDDY